MKVIGIEFRTSHAAADWAEDNGGAVLTLPGGRCVAVSGRDSERIEAAGGPAAVRAGRRPRHWGRTILTVGAKP
ncbi:MAG: hypothetical protein ACKVU4_00355 [Phycisphaerales bacterium]